MNLKLKESIRCNGVQHRPPAVIDTEALGISDVEAAVLVRRGVAVVHEEAAPAEVAPVVDQPEVTNLGLGEVEGQLAGVVDEAGDVVPLADMKKAELVQIATDLEIEGADKLNKAQLVAAIEAQKVIVPAEGTDADAGEKSGEDAGEE